MAAQSIVGEKSLAFAKRIAKCYVFLKEKKGETVMSKQLLRCGTSIGANVREGQYAQSKKDFISKLNIALKEARESLYWIELLKRNNYIDESQYQSIYEDCEELVKILVSRCKKLDQQINEEK